MEQIQFTDGVNLSSLEKARMFQKLNAQGTRTADDVLSEIESIDAEPTALSKASTLLDAAVKFISDKATVVSPAEQAERLAFCNDCPHLDPAAFMATGSCRLCGCSIKMKTLARTFACPLKKW